MGRCASSQSAASRVPARQNSGPRPMQEVVVREVTMAVRMVMAISRTRFSARRVVSFMAEGFRIKGIA